MRPAAVVTVLAVAGAAAGAAVLAPGTPASHGTSAAPGRAPDRCLADGERPARRVRPRQQAAIAARSGGLRGPGGRRLPLLNGVPAAPPIVRAPHLGPLPPVVAKVVDTRGDEWYEHADGSTTTTRFVTVVVDGVPRTDVETVHNAPVRAPARVRRGERAEGAEAADVRRAR